jgi:hypothetical protein
LRQFYAETSATDIYTETKVSNPAGHKISSLYPKCWKQEIDFHYAYIEYLTFSLKFINQNCIYSKPTTHFSLSVIAVLLVHVKDYLCVLYYRDPADKLIRHRACSLRDTAYTLIKAEMDSDFEEQCKEISRARRQRAESPSRFAPEFVRTKPQASQATPDEGLVNGYSFIFTIPYSVK